MILLQLAALDRRQQADRADRMLVDGVMVVHVELHLRDDAAEVGHEAAEHAGLVHPAQHGLRRIHAGQHLHEQGVGARVVADLAVDQHRIASRGAHRGRVDLQPLARGHREHLDQPHRIGAKKVVRRDRQAAAVEDEAARRSGPPADGRKREAEALLAQLLVELGEEYAGQVADRLGVDEVELHEALDRRFPGPVGVMHDRGDARLIFEAQPLLGPPGEQVQMAPHRPEKALGTVEAAKFGRGQKPRADQVRRALDAVDIFADPVERVEVAKPALAVLDVGLHDIAAVAHPDVALVALGELGGDEFGRGSGDHLLAKTERWPRRTLSRRPTSSALRGRRCGWSCPSSPAPTAAASNGPSGRP